MNKAVSPYSNDMSKRWRQNGKQCRLWSEMPRMVVIILNIIAVSTVNWIQDICYSSTSWYEENTETFKDSSLKAKEANESPYDKTNKMACAPSEDSDQPEHLPSLIRVFAVCMKKAWVLSYPLSAQRRLWSDWVDAQGWSESLLGAHAILLVLSWGGSALSLSKYKWVFKVYD